MGGGGEYQCNTLKNFSKTLLSLVYHFNTSSVDSASNGEATVPLPLSLFAEQKSDQPARLKVIIALHHNFTVWRLCIQAILK